MSRARAAGGLLIPLVFAGAAAADGPLIEHAGVGCVVAERFPRLEAGIAEPDSIGRARVQFRGEGEGPWYFVEMRSTGGDFTGILPKPKKSLHALSYYIEATDRQFRVGRTREFIAQVVPRATDCANGAAVAGVAATASVVVGAPAGAAAVPAGFSTAGLASATVVSSNALAGSAAASGAGISTAAVVGVIAGGAAIAGVAAATGGGGDSTTTTPATVPTPAPTTTLAPPPTTAPVACPACYAGSWQMAVTLQAVGNPPLCGSKAADVGKTMTLGPFAVSPDGSFDLSAQGCQGCAGHIDAAGNFAVFLAGDTQPGLTCPSGSMSGHCTSTSACSGTGSQGGDQFAITMSRLSP